MVSEPSSGKKLGYIGSCISADRWGEDLFGQTSPQSKAFQDVLRSIKMVPRGVRCVETLILETLI